MSGRTLAFTVAFGGFAAAFVMGVGMATPGFQWWTVAASFVMGNAFGFLAASYRSVG